jgi:hypothetical protein
VRPGGACVDWKRRVRGLAAGRAAHDGGGGVAAGFARASSVLWRRRGRAAGAGVADSSLRLRAMAVVLGGMELFVASGTQQKSPHLL